MRELAKGKVLAPSSHPNRAIGQIPFLAHFEDLETLSYPGIIFAKMTWERGTNECSHFKIQEEVGGYTNSKICYLRMI